MKDMADITKKSAGKGYSARNIGEKYKSNYDSVFGTKKFFDGRKYTKVYNRKQLTKNINLTIKIGNGLF